MDLADIHVEHHFGGGVYAKATLIPAGVELTQHRHKFDHLSILARGRVRLVADGVEQHLFGPACVTLKAGTVHRVQALTDALWYCVHATECTDPAQVDHELVAA